MTSADGGARVLLVHGLWNSRHWLAPLAWRLRRDGYQVQTFGYASVLGGPEMALPRLVARLATGGFTGVVGHSLGGLLALQALRSDPALPVRRVVCLGSPLCGSAVARAMAARHAGWVLGRSADWLHAGLAPWTGTAEVGMVAGNVARGFGRLFAHLAETSDGTVALAETRLPGLRDHCVVAASHSGLVLSAEVARQTAQFLREGRFGPEPARASRAIG
ncbi:MAG TPA: alpha/beta fold hydrolase [Stenotrophomonas sp.]|jgi:pimeloyl-ACP methyl ester carboxylesterase